MMIKAVAILTTFQNLPRSYGLVPVVLNQAKMLVEHGWEVGLFVQNGFQNHVDVGDVPEGVELMPHVPFCHLFDYQSGTKKQRCKVDGKGTRVKNKLRTNFEKQVKLIEEKLEPWLIEYPVVITHDILFQTWFVTHNQAIRNIAEKHPEIKWIHWLHSGPSARPDKLVYPHTLRFTGMNNSIFVSPNDTMKVKFAEMYDIPLSRVKTVYHATDIAEWYNFHPLTIQMVKKYNLLNVDAMVVWPTRIDHPEGKGMFHAIRLVAMMNRLANIKFVFLNSWSSGTIAKTNMRRLRAEAEAWGLPKENLIFSSEMGSMWENGVPREVVKNMFDLGEIFILPSQTETFSLVTMEAALSKNMLILNEDLGVFTELAGDRADYIPTGSEWGGTKVTRHYWGVKGEAGPEDPKSFWRDRAIHLLARLGIVDYHCEHCGKSLGKIGAYNPLRQHRHVLKTFNTDWVYKNQLEPLLIGEI